MWNMPVRMVVRGGLGGGKEGRRTEEETFPYLEEVECGKGAAGAEVCLQRRKGLFAGWTVCDARGF